MSKILLILIFICSSTLSFGYSNKDSVEIMELCNKANGLLSSNPISAREIAKEAVKKAEVVNFKEGQINALNLIGLSYYYNGDLIECKKYIEQSIDVSRVIHDSLKIANGLNNLGVVYFDRGELEEALKNYKKSLIMKRLINDSDASIAMTLNNIGNVLKDNGNLNEAIAYYKKSIVLKKLSKDLHGEAMTLNNIGLVYAERQQFNTATIYYIKSILIKEKIDDFHGIAMSKANLGRTYLALNKFVSAEKEILESVQIRTQIKDRLGLSESYLYLAEVVLKRGSPDKAIDFANRSMIEAKISKNVVKIGDAHSLLYQANKQKNNPSEALFHFEKYKYINDSISSTSSEKSLGLLRASLEVENLKASQRAQSKLIDEQKKSSNAKTWLIIVDVIALVMGTGLLYSSLKKRNKLTKLNGQLEEFSAVVQETDNYVIITDPKNEITWVNKAFETITGYSEKDVIGKDPIFLRGSNPTENQLLDNYAEINKPITGRVLNFKKDGSKIWLRYNVNPIFDENGKLTKSICVGSNITTQVASELKNILEAKRLKTLRDLDKSIARSKSASVLIEKGLNDINSIVNNQLGVAIVSFNHEQDRESFLNYYDENNLYQTTQYLPSQDDLILSLDKGNDNSLMVESIINEVFPNVTSKKIVAKTIRKKMLPLGIMIVVYKEEYSISKEEKSFINELSKVFAAGISQKKLQANLEMARAHQSLLLKVNKTILNSTSFNTVVLSLSKLLKSRYPSCTRSTLLMFQDGNDWVTAHYPANEGVSKTKRFRKHDLGNLSSIENKIVTYEPNLLLKKELSTSDQQNIQDGLKSYLIVPLTAEDKVLGSVNIEFDVEKPLAQQDIYFFEEMALSIAIAMSKQKSQDELEEKNKDMSDSIRYAERIQSAQLPNLNDLPDLISLKCIYKPKDIVSGDFYWAKETQNHIIFGLGDCTGHGVPGGFMTILGLNLLDRIVSEDCQTNPAMILELLHKGVIGALSSSNGQMLDGMDITIASLNKVTHELQISSANNAYVIKQYNEFQLIKANKVAIGDPDQVDFEFKYERFNAAEIEEVFFFSDGIQDQFGGEKGKKLTRKRILAVLESLKSENLETKVNKIENEFLKWQGDFDQTDDVSLMGVKFNLEE